VAREVRSIRHETAHFEPFAVGVHCGQSRREREATDPNLVGSGERITNNIKGLRAILECLEGRCDIRRLPDFQRDGSWDGKTRRIAVNARLLDDFEAADWPVMVLDGKNLW